MSGSGNWRALCALNDANTLHMDTKLDNILLTEGVGFDDLLLVGREVVGGLSPPFFSFFARGSPVQSVEF